MTDTNSAIQTETPLSGKRIVILGGSSGIGFAVAQLAVRHGAEVVVVSSNDGRVKQAVQSLGNQASGHAANLADEKAIEELFQGLGAFDHLVYTAGDTLQLGELATTDLEQARRAFELRFWSVLAAVKYAHPHIRKGGSIVLTTGVAGPRPQKGWVIGSSVCGAVDAMARALAVELAPVRVNAVSPGFVRSDLWRNMPEQEREQMYKTVGERMLVGRVGEVSDIARTYIYLMEEGFSTGQTIIVDGGAVLV